MADDPPMAGGPDGGGGSAADRRRRVVAAGHRGEAGAIEAARHDPEATVRAARLGALERNGALTVAELTAGLSDPAPVVRRRAASLAPRVKGTGSRSTLPALLVDRLDDPDPLVAEACAWALGERAHRAAVGALSAMATGHGDPRCREAAVAALGAIGDPGGLGAVLAALGDRPNVRRRAVVALAGFDGPAVEEALEGCLADPDWQVRQAAEILLER